MRFQPDNLFEMLLRPVAMAAPNANVYVEMMAPDFRFVFALALLAVLAVLTLRRRRPDPAPDHARRSSRTVFVLLAALALAFVPWLATTGNGRYFVPGLLIVGPVCIGLARLLPVTRALRLTLVAGMLALQLFAVQQSVPWRAWGLVAWKDAPYFDLEVPAEWRAEPATIVTMSAITYSLVAPQFHPDSRWMSLHNAPPPQARVQEAPRTGAFLAKAQPGRILLLVPVLPSMMTSERLPNAEVSAVIDGQLARYQLAFRQPQSCRFLASRALADVALGSKTAEDRARSGFWLCQLAPVAAGAPAKPPPGQRHDEVFKALEAQCPRFFPAGGDGSSLAIAHGEVRSYLQGEMKAYVYDNGDVFYKYYRALNPVPVGKAGELVSGKLRVDCGRIRGRSGLPWEREI